MARVWNTTGLYKHHADRQRGRPRRLRGTPPSAVLVPIDPARDVMCCSLCYHEFERRHALGDEACPQCRLVGEYFFTGRNAATT